MLIRSLDSSGDFFLHTIKKEKIKIVTNYDKKYFPNVTKCVNFIAWK